jgi:hypothetical protein
MAGYGARNEPSQGTIQDLYVKALAIEDAKGTRVVIVTADLCGYTYDFTGTVSKEIEKRLSIPRGAILFNASHTHCGPDIWDKTEFENFPGAYDIPESEVQRVIRYTEWLKKQFIDTISDAVADLKPASVFFSSAMPVPFAVSRRFPSPSGILYRSTPSSYYTEGPRDDVVPVLKVAGSNGSIRAILCGYACHPITLDVDMFCGDYPGYAQRYIEEMYPGATALFMQGCSGELVPNARFQIEYAMGHGKAIADVVKKALNSDQVEITGTVSYAYDEVSLGFQHVPDRKEIENDLTSENDLLRRKATYYLKKLDNGEAIPSSLPCPLQAIRFGSELLMVGIGGEPVADYAVTLKSEYMTRALWVAGYCNYSWGYLPTWKILKEGGYEGGESMSYTPFPGPFVDTVEETVLNGIRRLVKSVSE